MPGKFFIAIPETPTPLDPANDFFQLLHGNAITVSPMRLQGAMRRWRPRSMGRSG